MNTGALNKHLAALKEIKENFDNHFKIVTDGNKERKIIIYSLVKTKIILSFFIGEIGTVNRQMVEEFPHTHPIAKEDSEIKKDFEDWLEKLIKEGEKYLSGA